MSAFRSVLDVLIVIQGGAIAILMSFGYTDVAGQLSCAASKAPVWLLPYLALGATVLGVTRVILKALSSSGLFGKA